MRDESTEQIIRRLRAMPPDQAMKELKRMHDENGERENRHIMRENIARVIGVVIIASLFASLAGRPLTYEWFPIMAASVVIAGAGIIIMRCYSILQALAEKFAELFGHVMQIQMAFEKLTEDEESPQTVKKETSRKETIKAATSLEDFLK